MNNDVHPYDELDYRIINRLAERKRKIDRITEIEQITKLKVIYGTSLVLLAVACVAVLFIFTPWSRQSPLETIGIEPDMTEFRTASPEITEIELLIEKNDYNSALKKLKVILKDSDANIEAFKGVAFEMEMDDEEMIYAEQEEILLNSELRWTYIYLLIKCHDKKTAKKELKKYLKNKDYCSHFKEAKELYKEI